MPTDSCHVQLSHFDFLAGERAWENLVLSLQKPLGFRRYRLPPPDTPIETLLESLDNRLAERPGLRGLFHLNLLSIRLRFPEECPEAVESFLERRALPQTLLPGAQLPGSSSAKWVEVPILLALGENSILRFFIVGMTPETDYVYRLPPWAEFLLDDPAKDALADAVKAAAWRSSLPAGTGFYCFPLCIPNRAVQIQGRSLGLPLAIAFAGLLAGATPARQLAATGDLAPDGSVRSAGLLDRKAEHLAQICGRFKALLFPSENAPPAVSGIELLPVACLDEALTFAALYAPGQSDLLLQLPAMLKNPSLFVASCRSLDHRWICWALAHGKMKAAAETIAQSADLYGQLANRLEEALRQWNLDSARAISGLISEDLFAKASAAASLTAFKWCTLNLSLSNHLGDVAGAETWVNRAESMIPDIRRSDEEAVMEHYNTRLVLRHNHYRFSDRLPGQLTDLLHAREAVYRTQCAGSECRTDLPLGRLYGTLGQNLAFCGPAHITEAERYFRLAREALGEGTVAEHKPEWQRQLNYATYAYLDAGMFTKAEESLCAYLEIRELKKACPLLPSLDRWRQSLFARFLADAAGAPEQRKYLRWVQEQGFIPTERNHPWQLWAYNVGRIALSLGEMDAAGRMFKLSLELCLESTNRPTVCVMALLPLSGLMHLNALPVAISEIEVKVRAGAATLQTPHFNGVLGQPFLEAIRAVWNQPATLFRFTYR